MRLRGGAGPSVHYGTPSSVSAPLTVPTFDDDPSVTHPSVVDAGTSWNGYRYWMAYTPYPGSTREDPSVVASDDGIIWETPAGRASPRLVTQAQIISDGYEFGSDAHLLLTADRSALMLWYRAYDDNNGAPNNKEGIYLLTSTDGVTWTARQATNVTSSAIKAILSPAVNEEDDGSFTMWTVDAETSPSTIKRRTSADGVTWGAATPCTIPAWENPWHLDVVRRDGRYHMLLNNLVSGAAAKLAYLTSSDGLTWTRETDDRSVPVSGEGFDGGNRHYRSCFLPAGATHDRWGRTVYLWDVYVSGLPADHASGGAWRIGLYRSIALR